MLLECFFSINVQETLKFINNYFNGIELFLLLKKNKNFTVTYIKCKFCVKFFPSEKKLFDHFIDKHLSALDSIPCMFCDMTLANFDDMLHHLLLNHKGITSEMLSHATLARETKKQLGDYVDADGSSVECNFCFEMFSSLEKLNEHGIKEHGHKLNPEFIDKMKSTIEGAADKEQPICERCNRKFLGVIFTKIDNKVQNVCFNCYGDYFGKNALARLTIGTNDDMIAKLREPLE